MAESGYVVMKSGAIRKYRRRKCENASGVEENQSKRNLEMASAVEMKTICHHRRKWRE
jgi:hypothetical protein